MTLRFHEIAEANHRIQNPFTDDKLMLLGEVTRVGPQTRILDIACGKGELLCQWAAVHRVSGRGVDVSQVFLTAAKARAAELGVADRLTFSQGDAEFFETGESSPWSPVWAPCGSPAASARAWPCCGRGPPMTR